MAALWAQLDRIGIALGLVLAVPVFWTWWQVVFGERRQRRSMQFFGRLAASTWI